MPRTRTRPHRGPPPHSKPKSSDVFVNAATLQRDTFSTARVLTALNFYISVHYFTIFYARAPYPFKIMPDASPRVELSDLKAFGRLQPTKENDVAAADSSEAETVTGGCCFRRNYLRIRKRTGSEDNFLGKSRKSKTN